MAPTAPQTKPSARTLRHQRITGQIHPLLPSKLFRPDAAVSDSFLSSKRDKRLIKHSSFLSRVRTSSDQKSAKITKPRTRRPGKKIASLGSLGDALPELEEGEEVGGENVGKVKHKSLKSRPGALKRKERVVKGEMQRFGMSMAKLAEMPEEQASSMTQKGQQASAAQGKKVEETGNEQAGPGPASNRWAALRGYISSTMEQNPAFTKK